MGMVVEFGVTPKAGRWAGAIRERAALAANVR